jgi:hydrogenase maturation factor
MCRTTVGTIVSIGDGTAVVDLDGVERQAVALLIPDLRPGELVLVGLGTVLGRVTEDDRAALHALDSRNTTTRST